MCQYGCRQKLWRPWWRDYCQYRPIASQQLGLNAASISRLIGQSDAKVSAGSLENTSQSLTIEVRGALDTIERVRRIPVAKDDRGNITQLGDIATIERGIRSPQTRQALINNNLGVVVASRMLSSEKGGSWKRSVENARKLQKRTASANPCRNPFWTAKLYRRSYGQLDQQRRYRLCFNCAILFLTLGLAQCLIVSASLPLTFLFALAAMRFNGLPIHQMSITGLIVALGIMVDNAIVMTDTIWA